MIRSRHAAHCNAPYGLRLTELAEYLRKRSLTGMPSVIGDSDKAALAACDAAANTDAHLDPSWHATRLVEYLEMSSKHFLQN